LGDNQSDTGFQRVFSGKTPTRHLTQHLGSKGKRMSRKDSGHFTDKHPEGTVADPAVVSALAPHVSNGVVTCAAAHGIADDLKVAPPEVGVAIDLQEYRISKCQLGLFGYEPDKKCIKPSDNVESGLENALKQSAADTSVSCLETWQIARRLDIKRMAVSAACEALGIKVKPCQLGAF